MEGAAHTRTGGLAIGLRRGWGAWQRDLGAWLRWVAGQRFAFVDLGNDADTWIEPVRAAGVAVGSVDLPCWRELLGADPGRRDRAVSLVSEYIERCVRSGARTFLTAMRPEEPERPREENFDHMIDSYARLVPVLERAGAVIVIEGCPGPGVLCCTPETLRALFAELPSAALAINFDPSHLVRTGIDPLRFLGEFAGRVHHVHAKDTTWLEDGCYEFGHEQPATFAPRHGFGGWAWRYTIPGRGATPWTRVLGALVAAGFRGGVSVELEDEDFCGSEEGEQRGLRLARDFLENC